MNEVIWLPWPDCIQHGRIYDAGEQFVDAECSRPHSPGCGSCEAMNTVLARSVGGMLHQSPVTEHRRHIDDGTAAAATIAGISYFSPKNTPLRLMPMVSFQLSTDTSASLCVRVHAGVIHGHV